MVRGTVPGRLNERVWTLHSTLHWTLNLPLTLPLTPPPPCPDSDPVFVLLSLPVCVQLYFTKKFLQLNLTVNIHLTPYDATESILEAPSLYGLIFLSYLDLMTFGPEQTLKNLIPEPLDKSQYSVIVYDVSEDHDEQQLSLLLEQYGVTDVMYPPYTIEAFRNAMAVHQAKQEMRLKIARAAAAAQAQSVTNSPRPTRRSPLSSARSSIVLAPAQAASIGSASNPS